MSDGPVEPAVRMEDEQRAPSSATRHGAQILNGLSEGVIVQDHEGRLQHANAAARRLLGLTDRQIDGLDEFDPGWRAITEDGDPFTAEMLPGLRARDTGRTVRDVIAGVVHPGGRTTWLKMTAEPIFSDGDPTPQGTITTFVDITGHRVREDALREVEARYRSLIENSPDLLAVLEPDGRLRYASAAAQRILGVSPADFEGLDVFELVHPDEVEGVVTSFVNTSQQEGVNARLELRLRRSDGTYAPVEVVANNLLADPVVRGLVMTIRDLSDRYRAEDALLTSTFRLRTLIASLPAAVLVESLDGTVAIANTQLVTLFGLSGSAFDLVGADADEVHRAVATLAVDPEAYVPRVRDVLATHQDVTDEVVVLADGRTLERDYRRIVIDGELREHLWVYYDVTPHKVAESMMRGHRDEALEALEAKSQFLAMLSHEVRTPMNGIIGMLDLLRERSAALDDEIVDILTGVRAAAVSLMDVLDDSLDVARIESGQLQLQSVAFDLREVAEAAAETMGPLARLSLLRCPEGGGRRAPRRPVEPAIVVGPAPARTANRPRSRPDLAPPGRDAQAPAGSSSGRRGATPARSSRRSSRRTGLDR